MSSETLNREIEPTTYQFLPFDAYESKDLSSSQNLMRNVWGENDFSSEAYNRWLYIDNPLGQVEGQLVWDRASGELAAQYVTVPSHLWFPKYAQTERAILSVNTATNPAHQRKGLFVKSANLTFDRAKERGFSAVYGFPNDNSLPGFKKMGFMQLSPLQLWARPISVMRMGICAFSILQQWSNPNLVEKKQGLNAPFQRTFQNSSFNQDQVRKFIHVPRTKEWLDWRYANHPTRSYFFFVDNEAIAVLRPMEVAGLKLCLVMDFVGKVTDSFMQELLKNLKLQDIHLLVGVFSKTMSEISLSVAKTFWLKIGDRFSPKSFHVICKPLAQLDYSDRSFFSLGDIDIY